MEKLRRLKGSNLSWEVADAILLIVFIVVLFVFGHRFFDSSHDDADSSGRYNFMGYLKNILPKENSLLYNYLRLGLSEDTYPSEAVLLPSHCHRNIPPHTASPTKITAILTFSDHEFYGVKRILEGVLRGLVRRYKAGNKLWTEGDVLVDDEERNSRRADDKRKSHSAREGGNDDAIINAWRYVTEDDPIRNSDDVANSYDVICVVDDATALRYLVDEYTRYFADFRLLLARLRYLDEKSPTIKIPAFIFTRHEGPENLGPPAARMLALQKLEPAGEGLLVFFDSSAAYNKFWLSPLVQHIAKYPNTVALPHLDALKSPTHAHGQVLGWSEATEEGILNSLTWALTQRPLWAKGWPQPITMETNSTSHPTSKKKVPTYFSTPLLKGSTFAVREKFFRELGGYETKGLVAFGGGHDIDLSLNVWARCGRIDIVPCSRIAVEDLQDTNVMREVGNVKFLIKKWLNEQQREVVLRHFGLRRMKSSADGVTPPQRDKSRKCAHDFEWFREKMAVNLLPVEANAARFGALRVQTNRCGRLLTYSNKIKLDECSVDPAYGLKITEFFVMTVEGQIKVEGRCLATKPNAFIKVEDCVNGDNTQQWIYRDEELINVWSNYCAMHVTDPDAEAEGDRQIMMVQDCQSIQTKEHLFKKWNFLIM